MRLQTGDVDALEVEWADDGDVFLRVIDDAGEPPLITARLSPAEVAKLIDDLAVAAGRGCAICGRSTVTFGDTVHPECAAK